MILILRKSDSNQLNMYIFDLMNNDVERKKSFNVNKSISLNNKDTSD